MMIRVEPSRLRIVIFAHGMSRADSADHPSVMKRAVNPAATSSGASMPTQVAAAGPLTVHHTVALGTKGN